MSVGGSVRWEMSQAWVTPLVSTSVQNVGGEYLRPEHPNSPVVAQVFEVISIFIEPFFLNLQNSLLGSLGKYYHTFLACKEYKYLVVWGWLSDFTLLCLEVFHKCTKMQS